MRVKLLNCNKNANLNFRLSISDLSLGKLASQLLKLGVGLLEVIVIVKLESVLVPGYEPATPAA